jgi:putative restriction endonuclease
MEAENGYFALTDWDWYEFLAAQPQVDEVNFWQPHGNRVFRALRPGEPFFFKLKGRRRAIAGFGFFQRFEALPAWLAWECFEKLNGAPAFEAMVDRILRLRGEGDDRSGDFVIGCVMLSAPVFLTREAWVAPPADWARAGIQQGKRYPLRDGEGARVFRECLERATESGRYWNVDRAPEEVPRYGAPSLVRPRLGQGLFSLAVRDAYGGGCAVTGEHSRPVVEAAHIIPYGRGGEHRVDNGILLRSDLHKLYDRGYVTVTPDHRFRVGDSLRADYKNGRSYYSLDGVKVSVPEDASLRPGRERLEWHGTKVFRG